MLIPFRVRRLVPALVASALTISLVGAGGVVQAAPADRGAGSADRGAGWLAGQLTHGLIHNDQFDFDDYGLTIDTAFALEAIGGHGFKVRQIRKALAAHVGDYISGDSAGDPGSTYAGSTAKAIVLAETTGADPTDFGGVNLVKRLNAHVDKAGPAVGRIADESAFGDFANTVGQILAVRGLTTAKSGQAGHVRAFLLKQQCRQGYFRLSFSKAGSAHQSCGQKSDPDPDATSYAVVQLWKGSKAHPKLRSALERAAAWLARQQRTNGSLVGGTSTAVSNTNSTGLAAWAFGVTHRCSAARAAAQWVARFQVGPQKSGSPLVGQRGAIAYDRAGLKAAEKDGITDATQDQWRRATTQAAPALLFRHGC